MLQRKSPQQLAFANVDRLVFAGLYRWAPAVLDALKMLKPQTVIRWPTMRLEGDCRIGNTAHHMTTARKMDFHFSLLVLPGRENLLHRTGGPYIRVI
jgi:hypothetical protein